MRPSIVIIGAGIAGLTAAAILSRHANVTVVERAAHAGGKIETREIDGQPVDCGPTVLTLRNVFETIFREAGSELGDHLTLKPLDELARHFWNGGASLDLYADTEQSFEAVAAFSSRKEAEKYRAFSDMAGRVFDTLSASFMLAPEPDFFKLITSRSARQLLGLNPFESLWQVLSKTFDDPRLIQLFARYATYCGASPFQCPGTLMLVAHVEKLGVWQVPGGLTMLAGALTRQAEANGARFRYQADVSEIIFVAGTPSGVRLTDGTPIPANAVICNGDVAALAGGTFGTDAARALPARADTRSQSAMTWTFGGKADGPALSHHNVFFSDDYEAEFDAVFDKGAVPKDPTVYLCAPESAGPQPYFSLINAPANGDTHTYSDEETAECHARMTTRLQSCGLTLTPAPDTLKATTPTIYASRFPATGGALYGPASHGWRAAFKRQGVWTRKRGLYLAGGSVHPGPGLPMAALSGRAAAMEVMSDFGLATPRHLADMRGGMSMA